MAVGVVQMEEERQKLFIKKENGSITEKSHQCLCCLEGKLMQRECNWIRHQIKCSDVGIRGQGVQQRTGLWEVSLLGLQYCIHYDSVDSMGDLMLNSRRSKENLQTSGNKWPQVSKRSNRLFLLLEIRDHLKMQLTLVGTPHCMKPKTIFLKFHSLTNFFNDLCLIRTPQSYYSLNVYLYSYSFT